MQEFWQFSNQIRAIHISTALCEDSRNFSIVFERNRALVEVPCYAGLMQMGILLFIKCKYPKIVFIKLFSKWFLDRYYSLPFCI